MRLIRTQIADVTRENSSLTTTTTTTTRTLTLPNDVTVVLRKFTAAPGRRMTINGFSKMGPPLTLPLILYCGYNWQRFEDRLISRKCDIAGVGATLTRFKPPRFFAVGVIRRTECAKTTPRKSVARRQQLQPASGQSP